MAGVTAADVVAADGEVALPRIRAGDVPALSARDILYTRIRAAAYFYAAAAPGAVCYDSPGTAAVNTAPGTAGGDGLAKRFLVGAAASYNAPGANSCFLSAATGARSAVPTARILGDDGLSARFLVGASASSAGILGDDGLCVRNLGGDGLSTRFLVGASAYSAVPTAGILGDDGLYVRNLGGDGLSTRFFVGASASSAATGARAAAASVAPGARAAVFAAPGARAAVFAAPGARAAASSAPGATFPFAALGARSYYSSVPPEGHDCGGVPWPEDKDPRKIYQALEKVRTESIQGYLENKMQNARLLDEVNQTKAIARDAVTQAKTQVGRTAFRVSVGLGLFSFFSMIYYLNEFRKIMEMAPAAPSPTPTTPPLTAAPTAPTPTPTTSPPTPAA